MCCVTLPVVYQPVLNCTHTVGGENGWRTGCNYPLKLGGTGCWTLGCLWAVGSRCKSVVISEDSLLINKSDSQRPCLVLILQLYDSDGMCGESGGKEVLKVPICYSLSDSFTTPSVKHLRYSAIELLQRASHLWNIPQWVDLSDDLR